MRNSVDQEAREWLIYAINLGLADRFLNRWSKDLLNHRIPEEDKIVAGGCHFASNDDALPCVEALKESGFVFIRVENFVDGIVYLYRNINGENRVVIVKFKFYDALEVKR